MDNRPWLLISVLVLALGGCGKKVDESETGSAVKESPAVPTPIDPATVGAVMGKISFVGTPPSPQQINMDQDPACEQKSHGPVYAEDGQVNSNGTLPNAFVYVKAGAEKDVFTPPTDPAVLDQNGCMYKPHVLGLMAGQILKIVTSDDTTHNIHPMPQNNREWNMSQLPGAAPLLQRFKHPEVMIPIKCNQHPWMRAWLGVVANPFFAVTGGDGTYTLKGLPPGDYTIGVWTATFGSQEQKLTVGPSETKTADFSFKPN
jgi:hypothetical protein